MRRQHLLAVAFLAAPCSAFFPAWIFRSKPEPDRDDRLLLESPHTDRLPLDTSSFSSNMQRAKDTLDAYEKKPECSARATRALTQSCESIETDEREKTIYAVRLTGCEFATGDMPLPVECREISDPENDRHHSEDRIKNCVRSLEKSPQLWMSYSGSLSNAKMMCMEAGNSVERDNLLRRQRQYLHYVENTMAIMESLQRERQKWDESDVVSWKKMQQLQEDVMGFEPVFQKTRHLNENLSATLRTAQESKARTEDVKSGLDDLAENIDEGIKKVEASTEASISRTQNSWDRMDIEVSKIHDEQLKKLGAIGNRTDDLQTKLEKASCGILALFYIPMTMMDVMEELSPMERAVSMVIIGMIAKFSGVVAAGFQLVMATALVTGWKSLQPDQQGIRLSLMHVLLCIVVANQGGHFVLAKLGACIIRNRPRLLGRIKPSGGAISFDQDGGTMGLLDPPPRYSQEDKVLPERQQRCAGPILNTPSLLLTYSQDGPDDQKDHYYDLSLGWGA
ncbi:MAG: hypothetical protein J3Q66DRAFT_406390 [Benniella sp.]|nr:MAG: hypothetical protein J3Q66DRAFT_406390 [Benniella sp.]